MENYISVTGLTIFIASMALALGVALLSFGHDQGLLLWSVAMAMHSMVYGLFSLRIPLDPLVSVVLGNLALASTLALLAECVCHVQRRRATRWLIWLPVAVAAVGMVGLLTDDRARVIFLGSVFAVQSLFIVVVLVQKRQQVRHIGIVIVGICALASAVLFALRAALKGSGRVAESPLIVSDQIQTSTLLMFVVSVMLLTLGFELLIRPRGEDRKHD